MFSHFLAGELIFLFLGRALGFEITAQFLLFGAFCGFFPDFLSYFLNRRIRYDKWYHSHRDNFSHSLFLPVAIFAGLSFWIGWKMALLISLSVLSHPLIDLYGLGWGVKLFLPISDDIYKFLFKRRLVYVYKDDRERDHDIEQFQTDDWFQKIYLGIFHKSKWRFRRDLKNLNPNDWRRGIFQSFASMPKWWGLFEWISLTAALYLIFLYIGLR